MWNRFMKMSLKFNSKAKPQNDQITTTTRLPLCEVCIWLPVENDLRKSQVQYYKNSIKFKQEVFGIVYHSHDQVKEEVAKIRDEFHIVRVHALIHGDNQGRTCLGNSQETVMYLAGLTDRNSTTSFLPVVALWCYSKKHVEALQLNENFKQFCYNLRIDIQTFKHDGEFTMNVQLRKKQEWIGWVHSGLNPEIVDEVKFAKNQFGELIVYCDV
jgi:hypothetical protein